VGIKDRRGNRGLEFKAKLRLALPGRPLVAVVCGSLAAGLRAQERDLKAAGAKRIFGEQVSSTAKRAKLAECLAFLREGDVLTVAKPDRLSRSTAELLSI